VGAKAALVGNFRARLGHQFVVVDALIKLFFLLLEDLLEGGDPVGLARHHFTPEAIFQAAGAEFFVFGKAAFGVGAGQRVLFVLVVLVPTAVSVVGFFDRSYRFRVPSHCREMFVALYPAVAMLFWAHVTVGRDVPG